MTTLLVSKSLILKRHKVNSDPIRQRKICIKIQRYICPCAYVFMVCEQHTIELSHEIYNPEKENYD